MDSRARTPPSVTTPVEIGAGRGDAVPISFVSHNSSAPVTILFIHGAFGSHAEWDKVVSHVPPSYHILLPNLHVYPNGQPRPLDLALTISLLSTLVSASAKSGKAHVVGLSMGAHVAASFAAARPDLTLSLFASGFAPEMNRHAWYFPLVPYAMMSDTLLASIVPRWLVAKMLDGYAPDPSSDTSSEGTRNVQTGREIVNAICVSRETQGPVRSRTLAIVAGKRGVLPTSDRVDSGRWFTERMGGPLEGQGLERAVGATTVTLVKAPNMRHGWSVIRLEAFARSVCLWVDRGELDEEFELM